MDLEKLQEQADSDLKINDTELDLESLKTPQLHNKYSKYHSKYKNLLKVAEQDLARITREKNGIFVILFFIVFTAVMNLLYREYAKELKWYFIQKIKDTIVTWLELF